MTFDRVGRTYQLRIRSADDLANVLTLDEAHWVAISAPTNTIDIDPAFLQCLDTDGDGRVRPFELRHAIRWTLQTLTDHRGLTAGSDELDPATINADSPDGRRIIEPCRKIMHRAGDRQAPITLAEVRQIKSAEESRAVSEAGVVLAEAAEDADIARFIRDAIAGVGGTVHPSGRMGLTVEQLNRFVAEARGLLDWKAAGRIPEGQTATDIMPLGEQTADAFAALKAVRDKVDQFFAQCRAVRLDPGLRRHFGPKPADIAQRDLDNPADIAAVMADAPLAEPNPDATLDLEAGVNPAYESAVTRLRQATLEPILGPGTTTLCAASWQQVKDPLSMHGMWAASKTGAALEALGDEKLRQYLEPRYADAVRALVEQSRTTAFVLDNIRLVEKLILFQQHLVRFANNYVSFDDLYRRKRRALFDVGEVVMDGRRFNLAVRAGNRAEHVKVATTSNIDVLYLEVTGRDVTPYEVAVAVTSGGRGNLCVGKRGVFHDVTGRELDCRVVQVIENPISLREAVASPFVRLGRAIAGKIESVGASAEKQLDKTGQDMVTQVGEAPAAQTATPQATSASGRGAGVGSALAGGGIALAAVGSSMAYVSKTLAGLAERWPILLIVIAGAIAAVIVPTIIIAGLRLRQRDLSAILEGSGWGINARLRLTHGLAHFFTERPGYPLTARGIRRNTWRWIVAAGILAMVACFGWAIWQAMRVAGG